MDWATKRQLQYLSVIFFAIVLFVALPFYVFIYKAPTCFDGKKNGPETGIDCGGACKLLCTAEISKPLSRWDPRIFYIASSTYSVLAYLENPNVAAEVYHAPYSFKLFDSQGILITERKGDTYIPKGGYFAVFEPNIVTGGRTPARATFQFSNSLIWIRNTDTPPAIDVTNKGLASASTSPRVSATVKNNSLDTVSNIDLTSIVYDGSGNAIGASRTYVESLAPGKSKDVTFTWPAPFLKDTEVCSTPVDVILALDRSGSMSSLGQSPPQPLTDVKNAAAFFVHKLTEHDQASIVSFATSATTSHAMLTSNFDELEKSINDISILSGGIQSTNIADALYKSYDELNSARHRTEASGVIVLLTDGVANLPQKQGDATFAENAAQSIGTQAKNVGLRIFTIGLGKDVNTNFLSSLASTPDDFYLAPTSDQLTNIYTQIGTKLCTKKTATIEIIPRIFPYAIGL